MSYRYSESTGLLPSQYRPAGQLAVYDHIIERLKTQMPQVVYLFGADKDYFTNVDITYSFEYPEKMFTLPFVVITFISEISRNIGIGQVAAGTDFGEFAGMGKSMILQIDVWARNSMERDMISDALGYVMHTSRSHFCALGFRDVMPNLGQTRMFEQTRDTIYPRVAQATSRAVWRKVTTYTIEYDLVWVPPKDESFGIIEQIDINGEMWGTPFDRRYGHVTDLVLDSEYALKRPLGRFVPW